MCEVKVYIVQKAVGQLVGAKLTRETAIPWPCRPRRTA